MEIREQVKESVVFVGEAAHQLRYRPIVEGSFRLRSKPAGDDPDNFTFTEGEHYTIDCANGTIRRLPDSAIPDWRNHPMYNKSDFNHTDYPNFSNKAYTLYADYRHLPSPDDSDEERDDLSPEALAAVRDKLARGERITYVVFGDSISTGAEASRDDRKFYNLFAQTLAGRFAHAAIDVKMKAVGGETSRRALQRLQEDVVMEKPDLVTIGYGMNDQNKRGDGTNSVPLEEYTENIARMIADIRQHTEADIILITPCLPNPRWMYASPNATDYAEALRELGRREKVGVADVQRLWLKELSAGKTHESMLLNNVNHPNDYGHMLYAKALERLVRHWQPE